MSTSTAVISECERYRYLLTRTWDSPRGARGDERCLFVMLNPSTADGTENDPTIRRCIGFAMGWGFGGIEVVNLFAVRSTDPGEIAYGETVGPLNDEHIAAAAARASLIVVAWGAGPKAKGGRVAMRYRARLVVRMLAAYHLELFCLGMSKTGKPPQPKHPLYLAGQTPLQPFLVGGVA